MRITMAVAVSTLLFAVTATCQEIQWREITIESRHGGLEISRDFRMVIESHNGVIVSGKHSVNPQLVNKLIDSLTSPILPAPTPSNLGITEAWLKGNVPDLLEGTPNQRALFRETFTDSKTVADLLPAAFRFVKFDDYPQLKVTITLKDGGQWTCFSKSYYPFMLPWQVSRGDGKGTTYDADISRAIVALMPKGSLNRSRLGDEELKAWLSQEVMMHIKEQWNLIGVEGQAPDAVAELRQSFEVQHARIVPYRGIDYGYARNEEGPHEKNLLATLRQASLPANVAEDVVLLYRDGRVSGVSELRERISPYVSLALSVPWLSEYRAQHPEQKMYVRFVHDRSFSDKAMQNFTADMKQLGKGSLADEVATVQDKVALVFLDYGSDWLILPDKRMILWRHYLPASFLKWTPADFTFKRCVDYNANNGGCSGAVVSPDGVLEP